MNSESHPEPPAHFSERSLPILSLSGAWFRIHPTEEDPLKFEFTGDDRFTAPAQEYGILYLGHDECCTFIETFPPSPEKNTVSRRQLSQRSLSRIESKRSLRLVDLTGAGLAQLGADARLTTEVPYEVARRWGLAFWQHPDAPDGICYRARHDPSCLCSALYDRTQDAVKSVLTLNLLDPALAPKLGEILKTYQFDLV